MGQQYRSSLVTRLTIGVALTASIVLGASMGLTIDGLNRAIDAQSTGLSRLSEQDLESHLDGEARLAGARLNFLFNDADRRLFATSQRTDISKAVSGRNVAAMGAILGPAVDSADLDAIVVFDDKLRIIGSHSTRLNLLDIELAFVRSGLMPTIRSHARDDGQSRPQGWMAPMQVPPEVLDALAIRRQTRLGALTLHPVLDEFGDVNGWLLGVRTVRADEHTLNEFARLTHSSVAVVTDGETTFSTLAGMSLEPVVNDSRSSRSKDRQQIGRCADYHGLAKVCVLVNLSQMAAVRSAMVEAGQAEVRPLKGRMISIALATLIVFSAASLLVTRRIARPIARITDVLDHVAEGTHTDVPFTDRADEIGEMSRAVAKLQVAVMERDSLREEADKQNELFNAALTYMGQGLAMFDADDGLIVNNRRFDMLFGSAPSPTASFMQRHGNDVVELPGGRVISIVRSPMNDGGWVATYEDITERRETEKKIQHLATHDSLTGLTNRHFFVSNLSLALEQQRLNGDKVAVLALDLDRFKAVNDTYGHPVGDKLLIEVARRLREEAGPTAVIARFGGDEFAILLRGKACRADETARRTVAALSLPFDIEGRAVSIGTSIGIAIAPSDGIVSDELLRNADLALYQAKSDGKGRHCFFEPSLDLAMSTRRALEADLRHAVRNNQLEAHFQPIFDIRTRSATGFEALMRWRHPTRGMVNPGEFIPIAEETGLIEVLGEWMLREACAQATTWPSHLKVAVNVSGRQVQAGRFVELVTGVLAETGLSADRLELEITESVLLQDSDDIRTSLMKLRDAGVRFACDDFGTGFSSLSALRNFPFDRIKIDQGFVRGIESRKDSAAFVRVATNLAKDLEMKTTAEGVETVEQLANLRREGCTEVQGYLLGRPTPAHELVQFFGPIEMPLAA